MLAAVSLLWCPTAAQTCGDCNLDGQVSILDALAAARIAASILAPTPPQDTVCDIDGSTSITILDSLQIARHAAGLSGSLTCRRPPVWSRLDDGHGPGSDSYFPVVMDRARGVLLTHTGDPGGTYTWNGADWDRAPSTVSPAARALPCMAYDGARQEVVLFGGITQTTFTALGDTWIWNGATWRQAASSASPSPRYGCKMVYDSGRGVLVLFGGYDGGVLLGDTWEWDGASWTQRASASSPSPRYMHAMAYDAARGVTLLHGGGDGRGSAFGTWTVVNDTWAWDGGSWTELQPPADPFGNGRMLHALAFDEARQRVVMNGGYNGTYLSFEDTWEWDGASWTTLDPLTSVHLPVGLTPFPRTGHSLVFDPGRGAVLLIGGSTVGRRLSAPDVWAWDGRMWRALNPVGLPPPVTDHGLYFDAGLGEVVLLGGETYLSWFNAVGTWRWDGQHWTPEFPATHPLRRVGFGLAFDTARQRAVVFGGDRDRSGAWALDDTWEKGPAGWAQVFPPTSPPGRFDPAMAYDPVRGRTVLFGGDSRTGVSFDDTWEWNGVDWTRRPVGGPPARAQAAMVHTSFGGGGCILFGGRSTQSGTTYQDTWRWNGAVWTRLNTPIAPPARVRHAMTFDEVSQRVLLFGGEDGAGELGDTWTFDGATWTQVLVGPSPPARTGARLTYDPVRGRCVLFGGESAVDEHQDTWEWNGARWEEVHPQTRYTKPSPREHHAATYDSVRNSLVLAGGRVDYAYYDAEDRWVTWTRDAPGAWSPHSGGPTPAPRTQHAMAFDALRQVAVLFGGRYSASAWAPSVAYSIRVWGDTWEWDGAGWTEVLPAISPPPTFEHALAYDSARAVTVLYGGFVPGIGEVATTWEYDGATWTQRFPPSSPSPRASHSMAYDPDRGVTVLFGGEAGLGSFGTGTWEWDGVDWRLASVAVEPPARSYAVMAYDPALHATVLYGGVVVGPPWLYVDTWLYDGVAWRQLSTPLTPGPRYGTTLSYDPNQGGCVLFGGTGIPAIHGDLWILR